MQDSIAARATLAPPAPAPFQVSPRSVARRARMVFALAIGFYLYALVIAAVFVAAGIFAIPVVKFAAGSDKDSGLFICAALPITIFCFGSALLILWSLIPRPRRFVKPGPRLDINNHPQLLQTMSDVAQRTGQKMPVEVYAILDVNAAVTERGGILGLGKRRVLFLGLPMFSMMTVPQIRAMLAHEFGHFYWGDTRLGPWLQRVHEAMIITVEVLDQVKYTAWINILLFWYADWFLDTSADLMRKQEFLADQLAAGVAGPTASIEWLQLMHIGDDAFDAYWSGTIAPMLRFGVRLPVLDGFKRFLAVQAISSAVSRKASTRMKEDKTEDYHSHPALPERVAALAHMHNVDQPDRDVPALALLGDPAEVETALLIQALGKERVGKLRSVTWEEACLKAYLPMWEERARTFAPGLEGVTPASLPGLVKNLSTFGMELLKKSKMNGEFDSLPEQTSAAIGSALAVALHKAGWELCTAPGQPVSAQRGAKSIEPFDVLGKLVARKMSAEEWQTECVEAGIAGTNLGKLVTG